MAETLKYFTAVSSFLPGAHYVETQHVPPFHRAGNPVNLADVPRRSSACFNELRESEHVVAIL